MTDEASARTKETKRPRDHAFEWWREVMGDRGEDGGRRGNRAAVAALRRCRRPIEALMVPATLALLRRFPRRDPDFVTALAALAATLAHVREHDGGKTIAQAVGTEGLGASAPPKLSEGRFRRLLQADGPEALQSGMSRLMDLMGQRANVHDLADSMLFWNDRTRQQWVFRYYGVAVAAPKPAASDHQPAPEPGSRQQPSA